MSNRKTLAQKIEDTLDEIKQKEAQYKKLLREQKEADRKARNHRLCKRGGQVESLLPGLAKLTDEQFKDFVDRCLNTGFTKKLLTELLPPGTAADNGGDAATQSADTTAHIEPAPVPKPVQAAQNTGATTNTRPAQTAVQQGNGNNHGKPADAGRVAS